MVVYTIGYGGRGKEEFLELLRSNDVRTLVDIRLRPDKASMGIWVKARTPDKGIEAWLAGAGIGYRSLVELGNPWVGLPDWPQRYASLIDAAGAVLTERLRQVPGPFCLMCAEKRVEECHRRHVADYLVRHEGAEARHLG